MDLELKISFSETAALVYEISYLNGVCEIGMR